MDRGLRARDAAAVRSEGKPHEYRCHLGCILLKMPAISLRTGVGTALAKEFICLAPVLALQLGSTAFGAVFGFPEDLIKKAQQRRDVQQAISSLSQDGQSQAQTIVAAVRPQLLSCIEPTVEPLRALVSTTLEETSKWQEDFVSGGKNAGKSFPRRRVYRAGYIAADPGLRAACTDNLAGLYKKQGGTEPSGEKIKKKEAKALAEEAVQGFAAPTKKMDLLECQTAVELLAEEMALAQAMVSPHSTNLFVELRSP